MTNAVQVGEVLIICPGCGAAGHVPVHVSYVAFRYESLLVNFDDTKFEHVCSGPSS